MLIFGAVCKGALELGQGRLKDLRDLLCAKSCADKQCCAKKKLEVWREEPRAGGVGIALKVWAPEETRTEIFTRVLTTVSSGATKAPFLIELSLRLAYTPVWNSNVLLRLSRCFAGVTVLSETGFMKALTDSNTVRFGCHWKIASHVHKPWNKPFLPQL